MKILKYLLYVLIVLILIGLILGLVGPKTKDIQRSRVIPATPEQIWHSNIPVLKALSVPSIPGAVRKWEVANRRSPH